MKKNYQLILVFILSAFTTINSYSQFGPQRIITTSVLQPTSVSAGDLDGDGFIDVISGGIENDQLSWQKNLDGQGNFGSPNFLSNSVRPYKVATADINGDGFLDIWITSGGNDFVSWFENLDGAGNFGGQIIISNEGNEAAFIDIDGDNDLDVFIVSDSELYWKENVNGAGNFGNSQFIWVAPGATFLDVNSADIDNDGDQDVVLALNNGSFWFENMDGAGDFSSQNTISTIAVDGHEFLIPADVDGDGDMDVIASGRNESEISWFENTDGLGTFGPQQIINNTPNFEVSEMFIEDIDSDGDLDVISSLGGDGKIVWYKNINGTGAFGPEQIITTNVDGPVSVFSADLNNDSRADILSASISDNKVAWYPNETPLGVTDFVNINFKMFPNPVENQFIIEGEIPFNSYVIYDSYGRLLSDVILPTLTVQHEVFLNEVIASGVYFLKINGEKLTKTITFQKM